MGFADKYIKKNAIYPPSIKIPPNNNLKLILVIPCYNEPEILFSIDSLKNCNPTKYPIEIIVHINSGEDTCSDILNQNSRTEKLLKDYLPSISDDSKSFYVIHNKNLPKKHAGAGLARKIGMDEAIHRFNSIDNPNGVIISFDADTICDKNFLVEIEKQYLDNPKTKGSNVFFEHPIQGKKFSTENYSAIIKYELYLRYYRQSLKYTGYPYAFHTVGSIFNVKASTYIEQGGMNRKQAGEDFYFLQKIFPLGSFYEINSTCVYPSPRQSNRVPFGTGPMMKQIINDKGELKTYSFSAFIELKKFLQKTDKLYNTDPKIIINEVNKENTTLYQFLVENQFDSALKEINDNVSNIDSFRKRYFKWFNAFMILRYLNHSHNKRHHLAHIETAAKEYLKTTTRFNPEEYSTLELLSLFRSIEKSEPYNL